MADGYLNQCKTCRRKWSREYLALNRKAIRAYQLAWERKPENKAKMKKRINEWNANHPDRRHAAMVVGNALRDGKLKRHPCWVCGKKAQAHHPDYSAPLDVVWLCPIHHRAAHQVAA